MAEVQEASESEREKIAFNPPLYVQRDTKILELLEGNADIVRVLDLGCAECRLIKKLKEIHHVEFICGIDLEKTLLENSAHTLAPIPWNSLFPRSRPLKIVLLHGSMLEVDEIMQGCDVVILSEVVEHLVSEDLEKLPEVVFSLLKPRMCIVTTPNIEFNVVFGNMSGKFRHFDHKFEWTRREFEEWCMNITQSYPYSVEFDGVGEPPPTHPNVGFCSQVAVFRSDLVSGDLTPVHFKSFAIHDIVAQINYPHADWTFLKNRVISKIYFILESETSILGDFDEPPSRPDGYNSWRHVDRIYVSFEKLMENETIQNYFGDVNLLREFLEENHFELFEEKYVMYDVGTPSCDEDLDGDD